MSRIFRREGIVILVSAVLCQSACEKNSPVVLQTTSSIAPAPRVFRTQVVIDGEAEQLRAVVAWPADRELGMYEIAAVADPLIDLKSDWGEYIGVGQSEVDDADLENSLSLRLKNINSVENLVSFCQDQNYEDCMILVYAKSDRVFTTRISDIVVYTEDD